jgi:hypothetical protein
MPLFLKSPEIRTGFLQIFLNTQTQSNNMSYCYHPLNSNNASQDTDDNLNWTANGEDDESEENDSEDEEQASGTEEFNEGRGLAGGRPESQEYWLLSNLLFPDFSSYPECAIRTGVRAGTAQPASREHFNQHPIRWCREHHPRYIYNVEGCSIHRGVLNGSRCCYWCELERTGRVFYPARALQDCYGYPGHEYI